MCVTVGAAPCVCLFAFCTLARPLGTASPPPAQPPPPFLILPLLGKCLPGAADGLGAVLDRFPLSGSVPALEGGRDCKGGGRPSCSLLLLRGGEGDGGAVPWGLQLIPACLF